MPITVTDQATGEIHNAELAVDAFVQSVQNMHRQLRGLDAMRVSPVISARDQATAIFGQVMRAGQSLMRAPWQIVIRARDEVSNVLSGIRRGISSLASFALSPQGLVTGLLGAGAVTGGIIAPVNAAAEMQEARGGITTQFAAVGKSAQEAMAWLGQLRDFANQTPFEFPELRPLAQRLMGVGFAAQNIIPMLTSVGDFVSGMGLSMSQEGQRIVRAMTQMTSSGRVLTQDMNQLTEAGVPAFRILAEGWGVTESALRKAMEQGLVPANKSMRLLLEGMERLAPNAMAAASRRWKGLTATIHDTWDTRILVAWGEGITQEVQPHLENLVDLITKNDESVTGWENKLRSLSGQLTRTAITGVQKLGALFDQDFWNAPTIGDKIGVLWGKLESSFNTWWTGGGQKWTLEQATKIGGTLGAGLGATLMGLFGAGEAAAAGSSPFSQAGAQAGGAFLDAFLAAFDGGKIAAKAVEAFQHIQPTALGGQAEGGAGIMGLVLDAFLLAQVGGMLGKFGGLGKVAKWGGGAMLARRGAPVVATAAAAAGAGMPAMARAGRTVSLYGPNGEVLREIGVAAGKLTPTAARTAAEAVAETPGILGSISRLGPVASKLPGIGLALTAGVIAIEVSQAEAEERAAVLGRSLSGVAGAMLGSALGAALGTALLPGAGTVIGGVAGGIAGDAIGRWLADFVMGHLGSPNRTTTTPEGAAAGGVPRPNIVAPSGALGPEASEEAIKRAKDRLGQSMYQLDNGLQATIGQCERFIELLYGTSDVFGSATAAGNELMQAARGGKFLGPSSPISEAPRGSLAFFTDPTGNGHVGLSLGGGSFMHMGPKGIQQTNPGDADYDYYQQRFRGYGYPNFGTAAGGRGLPVIPTPTPPVATPPAAAGSAPAAVTGTPTPAGATPTPPAAATPPPAVVAPGTPLSIQGSDWPTAASNPEWQPQAVPPMGQVIGPGSPVLAVYNNEFNITETADATATATAVVNVLNQQMATVRPNQTPPAAAPSQAQATRTPGPPPVAAPGGR